MAEYIERQAAIDALGEEPEIWCETDEEAATRSQWEMDKAAIESVPPADVRPVRRGRWALAEDGWYCTVCKMYPPFDCDPEEKGVPYCPYCGADLRGGDSK